MTHSDIAARFRSDTARHQMTVLHDDGLYRHLHFAQPKPHGDFYWFDLITVPGALIFQGDVDTVAFRRAEDMFEFFRTGIRPDGSLRINPGYWAQKLTSDRDSITKYSEELFQQHVAEELKDAEADYPGVTKAWEEHVRAFDTDFEHPARDAALTFEFGVTYRATCPECDETETFDGGFDAATWTARHHRGKGCKRDGTVRKSSFYIDATEWDLRDHSWQYLWACHAIVWGIARWDKLGRDGLRGLATQAGGAR